MSEREPENPEECYACGYETDRVKPYDRQNFDCKGETMWLCELCAGSLGGNAFDWPAQYDQPLFRTICYVANVILDEVREGGGR